MSTIRPTYDVPTMPFDALPRLTSWQRSRMVRSTRKLAKILGETPVPQITHPSSPESFPPRNKFRDITQECPRSPIVSLTRRLARTAFEPIQVALRRDPDSDSEGARSTESESACVGTTSHGRDQSPVLIFGAPNLESVDSRACHISQVSSDSPSPIEPRRRSSLTSISSSEETLSPAEWEQYKEEREVRSRRKRLSKLTRYLGESIPPDLIFPNTTFLKPKSNTKTLIVTPPVVSDPTGHSVAPPLEQGTIFSSTTLLSPIPKSPKPAVVRTADSFVGSIRRSLSHRFNADATSPRLLAWRHRHSHSETTLSLTLLRPDTYSAADDHPGTPVSEDIGSVVPHSAIGAAPRFPPPTAGHHSP